MMLRCASMATAASPQSEHAGLRIAGPFTIPGLLGREFSDERTLSLGSAPAYVAARAGDDESVEYALVLGDALGRRSFMDLLYTLAPYQAHGPDRFARVIDNWHLHDRALTSSGSENLLLQHAASLKLSWHEFARHRELYISVFEDLSEGTRLLPVLAWRRRPDGVRRWQFDAEGGELIRKMIQSTPVLADLVASDQVHPDALTGLVTIPYFLPESRRGWRAWQPLVKNGKSNYVGPASVPVVALMHRRALLNSAIVRSAEACIDA